MRLISDETLAIMTIWAEARGEPYEGKVAVAEVIRNRARRKYNSDGTIAGTVLAAYQFSWANTGDANRVAAFRLEEEDPIVQACADAWEEAGAGSNSVQGAVLYLNPKVLKTLPKWYDPANIVATVGRHVFLKG